MVKDKRKEIEKIKKKEGRKKASNRMIYKNNESQSESFCATLRY
jgi:hypothetical protein